MSDYAVIVSARMASSRLPEKTLAVYCPDGTPNLEQIILRWLNHSRRSPSIIVSVNEAETPAITQICSRHGVPVHYRPGDVLECMVEAIDRFAPDAQFIARALGDNPLVDVGLADWRLDVLAETGADGLWYGGGESRLTYAATTDVWSRAAWDRIATESSGSQREHPGAYYWDNLSRFNVVPLPLPMREYLAPVRTELDTAQDLEMFRRLWRVCDGAQTTIPTLDALDILIANPEIAALNADVPVKTQSRAIWKKGMHWLCDRCNGRMGGIVEGNLEVRCAHCGKPRKWYTQKPKPSMMRY